MTSTAKLNTIMEDINKSDKCGVISVSGGGTAGIHAMMSRSGSSSTILQVDIRQELQSIHNYLGYKPDSYCSSITTRASAMKSLQIAESLGGNFGMAVNCTLATNRKHRGEHRCFIAIQSLDESTLYSMTLEKGYRNRLKEEEIVASLMVNALASLAGTSERLEMSLTGAESVETTKAIPKDEWKSLRKGEIGRTGSKTPAPHAVFPGSFNPLHEGHLTAHKIAEEILKMPVVLEVSLENAGNKPLLDYFDMETRSRAAAAADCDIVFTRAPLFLDKIEVFGREVPFVVGIDTMDRICDPKYYKDTFPGYDSEVRSWLVGEYQTYRNRFLVFGREKSNGTFSTVFNTRGVKPLLELCDQVPQDKFHLNVSSTDIRRNK